MFEGVIAVEFYSSGIIAVEFYSSGIEFHKYKT